MLKSICAVVAVGALAIAAPASAADVMTATLAAPVAKPTGQLIINGVLWKCLGAVCATASSLSPAADSKSSCRKLVKEVGKVTAFTAPKGAMSAADLEACNS